MASKLRLLLIALLSLNNYFVHTLKILMAGDFEPHRREWYWQVAQSIAQSPRGHSVFFLTTEYTHIQKVKVSSHLFKYGIGSDYDFSWDPNATEEENRKRLDLNSAQILFK